MICKCNFSFQLYACDCMVENCLAAPISFFFFFFFMSHVRMGLSLDSLELGWMSMKLRVSGI